jgi:hypothetical protein
MLQDTAAQAIIKFAFEQQEPLQALKSLVRVGQIAGVYYSRDHGLTDDFDDIFSFSNTK